MNDILISDDGDLRLRADAEAIEINIDSKHEELRRFSAMAMQGLLSDGVFDIDTELLINHSIGFAKELIKQLDKGKL